MSRMPHVAFQSSDAKRPRVSGDHVFIVRQFRAAFIRAQLHHAPPFACVSHLYLGLMAGL